MNEGTVGIGGGAFAGCEKLAYVYIPKSVTRIQAEDSWYYKTFDGTPAIWGTVGSAAETFARENGLVFQDTTTGQTVFRFKAGKTIRITAVPDPGYHFVSWSSSTSGVTFADANSATTTFVMPATEVTITATFAADT